MRNVTDFRYVRFHGILDDEVGSYTEDEHGEPVYNFAYVDAIYDGLLKNGVRPVVEISFMPTKLAFNPLDLHVFWYHPNVSPPKSWERWNAYMTAFAQDLVNRYGIDEVAQWYFEVWNEPNIDFWGGIPRQGSYFELYAHTARDLKKVSPSLRVGGPATAAASWVAEFLDYVTKNNVPSILFRRRGMPTTRSRICSTARRRFRRRPRLPRCGDGAAADSLVGQTGFAAVLDGMERGGAR